MITQLGQRLQIAADRILRHGDRFFASLALGPQPGQLRTEAIAPVLLLLEDQLELVALAPRSIVSPSRTTSR